VRKIAKLGKCHSIERIHSAWEMQSKLIFHLKFLFLLFCLQYLEDRQVVLCSLIQKSHKRVSGESVSERRTILFFCYPILKYILYIGLQQNLFSMYDIKTPPQKSLLEIYYWNSAFYLHWIAIWQLASSVI
jgi:hypothetical protein